MMLNVKVVPNAKQERLVREADRLKVYICTLAVDGRANERLLAGLYDEMFSRFKDPEPPSQARHYYRRDYAKGR